MRDPLGPDERVADEVEVEVPHVHARHPQRGRHLEVPDTVSVGPGESSVESGGGNGVWSPNQKGSSRLGGSKRPSERELGLVAGGSDRSHGLADVDAEQARELTGERNLAGPLRGSPGYGTWSVAASRNITVSESGAFGSAPASRTVPRPCGTISPGRQPETSSSRVAFAVS